jgi:hypothetical protein
MLACPFRTSVALFSTPISMEKYLCYRTRTEEDLSLNEVKCVKDLMYLCQVTGTFLLQVRKATAVNQKANSYIPGRPFIY